MKKIGKKVYRKEGKDRERLYTEIVCEDCGNTTYQRRSGRIQKALEAACTACVTTNNQRTLLSLQASRRNDGRRSHPLYFIYHGMMARCYDTANKNHVNYGFRGIGVCVRWIVDFWAFVEDMGERPSLDHSLDRVDNDGPYDPRNCKWSTQLEQVRNRRPKHSLLTPDERKQMDEARRMIYRRKYHKKTYQKRSLGWWSENFGLYNNPYVYGPMQWKRTSLRHRKDEAIERGWHLPLKIRKK